MYKTYKILEKTVHFNQNSQTPAQKMPAAFLRLIGNRQLGISFQSGGFYSHHFGKTQPELILKRFSHNKREVSL
jgi:hypothetical protein